MKNGNLIELIRFKPSLIDWENKSEVEMVLELPNSIVQILINSNYSQRNEIVELVKKLYSGKSNYRKYVLNLAKDFNYTSAERLIDILKIANDVNLRALGFNFFTKMMDKSVCLNYYDFKVFKDVITHPCFMDYADKNQVFIRNTGYLKDLLKCFRSDNAKDIITNPHIMRAKNLVNMKYLFENRVYNLLDEDDIEKILSLFDKVYLYNDDLSYVLTSIGDFIDKKDLKYKGVLNLLSNIGNIDKFAAFRKVLFSTKIRESKYFFYILSLVVDTKYGYEIVEPLLDKIKLLNRNDLRSYLNKVNFNKKIVYGWFYYYAEIIESSKFKGVSFAKEKREKAIEIIANKSSESYLRGLVDIMLNINLIRSQYYIDYITTGSIIGNVEYRNAYEYAAQYFELYVPENIKSNLIKAFNECGLKNAKRLHNISRLFGSSELVRSLNFKKMFIKLCKSPLYKEYYEIITSSGLKKQDNYLELIDMVLNINNKEALACINYFVDNEKYFEFIPYIFKTKSVERICMLRDTLSLCEKAYITKEKMHIIVNNLIKPGNTLCYKILKNIDKLEFFYYSQVIIGVLNILGSGVNSSKKMYNILRETLGKMYYRQIDEAMRVLLTGEIYQYDDELTKSQNEYIKYLASQKSDQEVEKGKFISKLKLKA